MRVKRSLRIFSTVSLATPAAIRLAVTLPKIATAAQKSITPPSTHIHIFSPIGTTSSIMYASIIGMRRSMSVPMNFTQKPPIMRATKGLMYDKRCLIPSPPYVTGCFFGNRWFRVDLGTKPVAPAYPLQKKSRRWNRQDISKKISCSFIIQELCRKVKKDVPLFVGIIHFLCRFNNIFL